MTDSEFMNYKNLIGIYEKGKNYNKIIDGHGTGLIPPTEEQWEKIKNQPLLVEKIIYTAGTMKTPVSFDNSATIWFPPIGNQGYQNSCVSWACGYYTKTFQEAKEHNWDLSGCIWANEHPSIAYQDKIFSPAFIYNLINWGKDGGTDIVRGVLILENIGCCTWDKMPYYKYDYTTWPSESAWRQAPWYRSQPSYGWYIASLSVDTDAGIENLKQFIANGNLALISVNTSYFYSKLGPRDLWTIDNYNPSSINHENTVVGYDDNYGPYTESGKPDIYGAFKIANSWGVGGWEQIADGFYYISYECIKQRIKYICLYQNLDNYMPQLIAVIKINHNYRGNNLFDLGLGDPSSPSFHKYFCNFSTEGGNYPFPQNPIVIDISEFLPYLSQSNNQIFLGDQDQGTTRGTLESFSVELYDNYATRLPKNVYSSTETPVNTAQGFSVYANVFTGPLPVELTSLTATIKNSNVLLNWETATEVNNYGFEVERIDENSAKNQSTNQNPNWQKLGFVRGHGNSNSPKTYDFTDENLNGGTNFKYRLKQIDNDGQYEYSKEVEVEVIPDRYILYQNYPNPFNPITNFKFQIVKPGLVILKIYDSLGKEITTVVKKELEVGSYSYQWDGSKLTSGIYFFRLSAGNYVSTKKLLLLK